MKTPLLAKLLGAALLAGVGLSALAAEPVKVRMSFDEDMVVTRLAESLGYFKQEGVEIVNTEMVVFELLGRAGTVEFREVSGLIR